MGLKSLASDLVDLVEYKDNKVDRRVRFGQNMIGLNKIGQAVSGNPQTMHLWNARRARQNEINQQQNTPAAKAARVAAASAVPEKNWKDKFKQVMKRAGHELVHPFVFAKNLMVKPEARKKFGKYLKGAVRKEVKETKHLRDTIAKALRGERVYDEDREKAINQMIDLAKVSLLAFVIGHLFHGGIVKAIGTLASPADEAVAIAVDKPLRNITEKAFGHSHGLLPSAFYESSDTVDDVLDRIIDEIILGIANSDFNEEV